MISTSYASMRSNAEQVADFLPILHKTLEDAGLDVGIACCEQTGWQATKDMVSQVQAHGVEHLLTTWASHEYTSPIDGPLDTELSVWQSEYCDLSDRWNTAWDTGINDGDGFRWASILHRALAVGNVNAYFWWLVVQDEATNDNNNEKLIMVEDGDYFTSKRAWAFAHYSRFIRPDAFRVETRGGDLSTSAYENKDGSLVVVILNPHFHDETVNLKLISCRHKNTGWGKVTAWLTDEEHDIEEVPVEVDDEGYVKANLPARGLITIKAVADE